MAIDDYDGEAVLGGFWLYDGTVRMPVSVMKRNFDRDHADYLEEMEHVRLQHNYEMPPPPPPKLPGPDGVFYYVLGSPGFETIDEAKAWADNQPWGPVTWSEA
ncbi:hypothetical protein [Brevundimonas diminuta]|uniref:hypothetical protein n=1 Tax=Brevundimonas diminuta TaxID=293 RepID=UPI0035D81749